MASKFSTFAIQCTINLILWWFFETIKRNVYLLELRFSTGMDTRVQLFHFFHNSLDAHPSLSVLGPYSSVRKMPKKFFTLAITAEFFGSFEEVEFYRKMSRISTSVSDDSILTEISGIKLWLLELHKKKVKSLTKKLWTPMILQMCFKRNCGR
jgi:hypothetical protein